MTLTHLRSHALKAAPPGLSWQSSGAVWKSRWPSWAFRPNEPSGFRGPKAILIETMLTDWSQLVPNMSTDIRGHEALLHHHQLSWHGSGPSASSPIDVTSLLHPSHPRTPHSPPQATTQHARAVSGNYSGQSRRGSRRHSKAKLNRLVFGYPEYRACSSSVSKGF